MLKLNNEVEIFLRFYKFNDEINYGAEEHFFSKFGVDFKLSFIKVTVCPRSSDPFYIVSYYIIWATTWTHS